MSGNKPSTTKKPSSKKAGNKSNQMTVSQAVAHSSKMPTGVKAAARQAYKVEQAIIRNKREALAKFNRKRLALNGLGGERCYPSTQVYGGASRGDKKWICSNLHQITFREHNYDIRECEVRVFIEGAEVTPYIRGTISWSIQSTGGMNSCTFSLNNNHDAFILTPANVCSRTDLHGWRVPLDTKKRLITSPARITRNVDETAKYIIYKNKYERIRPGTKGQQINEAGFWLYPLNPFFSVINKHDCVRVFYRLPHVTGVCKTVKGACVRGKHAEYEEAWAPAFAGFVDEYDFEDDPVGGDRVMNIRCYDWRGLLNRMRVRMQVNPAASAAAARASQENSTVFDEQKKQQKKEKGKGGTTAFLDVTSKHGINKDLISLYQNLFDARVSQCSQGGNYAACTQEAYKNVRQLVADKIAEMKLYYLGGKGKYPPTKGADGKITTADRIIVGVKPSQEAIKKAEGITIELTRTATDTIGIKPGAKKGAKNASEAVEKASKFLKSTGSKLVTLAVEYSLLYTTLPFSDTKYDSSVDLNAPKPVPKLFLEWNLTDPINQKDSAVAADTSLPNDLVLSISTNASTNRVYLINQYISKTVTDMFLGVSPPILKELDTLIQNKVQRRLFGVAAAVSGNITATAPVSFTSSSTTPVSVADAMHTYISSGAYEKGRTAKAQLTSELANFNAAYKAVRALLLTATATALAALKKDASKRRRAQNDELRKKYEDARRKAQGNPTEKSEPNSTVADLVQTDARFNQVAAGMYGDLVRTVGLDAHPLAGMSFEMAVEWLTLTHTPISKGFEDKLQKYDRGELQTWNMNVLFGIIGRPLTYREVTAMGKGTLSDVDTTIAPYSPLNPFMHMLLPKDGTGASSIVQQDITHNSFGTKDYTYQTRLELLNKICQTLDYQFFVSPAGDLVFEFPHYNSMPYDFGKVFQGAYTIVKGLRSFKIASEQGDLNTAWVITGKETDRAYDAATDQYVVKNTFKKNVIVANILARRVGIKVRYLQIELPGVGAILRNIDGVAEATRIAYGLLEIQRELGRMETASVSHDFRPYMLPNRPVHIIHRQRMALIRSVSYSMSPPNGECTSSLDLHYIRGLHQDGSFRHIAGGTRLPVDYSGLYTGDVAQTIRFGAEPRLKEAQLASNPFRTIASQAQGVAAREATKIESSMLRQSVLETTGRRQPRNTTNWACGPYLKDRWITASASYSDQMDTSFRKADRYSNWTQGANGLSGDFAPLPRGGASYIASRHYRPASANGDPGAAATFDNTGLDDANAGASESKNPIKTKTGAFYGNLYNPWPYGRATKKTHREFNQWGFFRFVTPSGNLSHGNARIQGKGTHRGKIAGWHSGVDFYGSGIHGKTAWTPIAVEQTQLLMGVGFDGYRAGNAYVWSKTYPGAFVTPAGEDALFVINKKGRPITQSAPGVGGVSGVQFKLDGVMRKLYRKVKDKYKMEPKISRKYGSHSGLVLQAYGYASMPGNASSKVACRLQYVHCSDLIKHKNGHWIGKRYLPREKRRIEADSPFVKVGTTGTSQAHLHFGMMVYRPGAKIPSESGLGTAGGSESSYKEILKANHEFLRTQMKMKLTGGLNNADKGKLSDSWQRYFERLNKSGTTRITTVDQAVEYMLKRSSQYWNSVNPSDYGVHTNPLFFFKPEQIIKDFADKYKAYRDARPESLFAAPTGSSVCGANNAVMHGRISLEYTTCLGKVRKDPKYKKGRNKKDARKVCRAFKDKRRAKLTQRKATTGTVQQTGGKTNKERVQRKLDARVAANSRSSGNRAGNRSTSGS